MKKLLLIILVFAYSTAFGQTYSVIHVLGKIYVQEEGVYLKPGQRIESSRTLRFETPEAKAAVLSSDRGRYVLQPKETTGGGNDLIFALSSVVNPVRGRMSTRAGGINNKLDFEKRMSEPIAWVSENLKFKVSPGAYPMSEQQFFFIRYQYRDELINKKLNFFVDTLILNKSELFMIDKNPIDITKTSSYQLFYYDASNQSSEQITRINFSFPSIEESQNLYKALEGQDQWDSFYELFNEIYGTCSQGDLRKLLQLE